MAKMKGTEPLRKRTTIFDVEPELVAEIDALVRVHRSHRGRIAGDLIRLGLVAYKNRRALLEALERKLGPALAHQEAVQAGLDYLAARRMVEDALASTSTEPEAIAPTLTEETTHV
jgi:hypothetical protein